MNENKQQVKIAFDVFGGDRAPDVCFDGVLQALSEDDSLLVYAVGKSDVVDDLAIRDERIIAVHAEEVIGMEEHPVEAIRSKKDSSICIGAKLVKDGIVDGFFSAGSTGALLAAATLISGRIKGVKRPAIGSILPGYTHPVLLMDVGANADCKPEMLLQFAKIGSSYMKCMCDIKNPTIALLNIGEEETKGNSFSLSTHALLQKKCDSFIGNCESKELFFTDADIVLCDGFTGNITLKSIEGSAKYLLKLLKDAFLKGGKQKAAAFMMKSELQDIKRLLDPEERGGSPLLGIKGAFLIGHGSSGPKGIKNGILETARIARSNLSNVIAENL